MSFAHSSIFGWVAAPVYPVDGSPPALEFYPASELGVQGICCGSLLAERAAGGSFPCVLLSTAELRALPWTNYPMYDCLRRLTVVDIISNGLGWNDGSFDNERWGCRCCLELAYKIVRVQRRVKAWIEHRRCVARFAALLGVLRRLKGANDIYGAEGVLRKVASFAI